MCEQAVNLCLFVRSASFKEDGDTWKGNDDGKVVNNQPQRVMDERNGLGPQGGYIARYDTVFLLKRSAPYRHVSTLYFAHIV